MTPQLISVLQPLKAETDSSPDDYVISVDGKSPFTDKTFARAVARLFELKDENDQPLLSIEKFSPHDLRRTLRSHLSTLGVSFEIAEKCLNHSLGSIPSTYDLSSVFDYRRSALEKWNNKVFSALKKQ